MKATTQKGSLLIEILIVLALFAVISLVIGQSLFAGLFAERESHEQEVGRRSAEEEVARVRAVADTAWMSLGGLPEDVAFYVRSDGVVATGSEALIVDGVSLSRSFTVRALPRDTTATSGDAALPTTRIATGSPATLVRDRGSLLSHVMVTWSQGGVVSLDTVVARWRNVVCGQSDWSATSTSVRACGAESAGASAKTNIKTGANLQLCNGC